MIASTDIWPQDRLIAPTIMHVLPPRKPDSHKGDFGSVGLLGGATGMTGALLLCARAALYLGAGKVYAASLADKFGPDLLHPELMWLHPEQMLEQEMTVFAVGPGYGRSKSAQQYLAVAIQSSAILVLDADALNLLAASQSLKKTIGLRTGPTLLTPHPGEAAALLGCDAKTIQLDRLAAAIRLAAEYRAWVVLKGAGSICVAPDGDWRINTTGNPGLSSPGTGDVLTGILAALLAQDLSPFIALQLAVYLHGAAADSLVKRGIGPIGLIASELLVEARNLLNGKMPP